jgi:hypothetical protein
MQQQERIVTRQTLAAVLAASDRAADGARAWFLDESRLRAAAQDGDQLLYEAERDILPPVRGIAEWRLDRVWYPAADLPTGELNRSTGHWNGTDQWEVFQVDSGEVVIVVRAPGSGRPIELVRCAPGSVLPLPPGCWHLTYVWRGPAVVTNAYSVTADQPGPEVKYFTRRSVRCALRRAGSGVVVVRDPDGERTDRDGAEPAQDGGDPVWRDAEQPARIDPLLPALEEVFAGDPDGRLLARLEESYARLGQRTGR